MAELIFNLNIPAEEYLRVYQGKARQVLVRAQNGQRVTFDARHLRAFVSREGVHGRFKLESDALNRFKSLTRI